MPMVPLAGGGAYPGNDTRAGLAQVSDFSKLPELLYGPELGSLQAQVESERKRMLDAKEAQQKKLAISGEAWVTRNQELQQELASKQREMQELLAFGNQYNIDLGAAAPSPFVMQNPELFDSYKRFNQLAKDAEMLSTTEKGIKERLTEAQKNLNANPGKLAPSLYFLSLANPNDPDLRKRILERGFGITEEQYKLLDPDLKESVDSIIAQQKENARFGGAINTASPLTLQEKKYAEAVGETQKLLTEDASNIEEKFKQGDPNAIFGYYRTEESKGIPRDRALAAFNSAYFSQVKGTTLEEATLAQLNNNNVQFLQEQTRVAKALSDDDKAKVAKELGVETFDPTNRGQLEAFFSRYSIKGGKLNETEATVSKDTGMPLRFYGERFGESDDETRAEFFADNATFVTSYENRKEGLKADALQQALAKTWAARGASEDKVSAEQAKSAPIVSEQGAVIRTASDKELVVRVQGSKGGFSTLNLPIPIDGSAYTFSGNQVVPITTDIEGAGEAKITAVKSLWYDPQTDEILNADDLLRIEAGYKAGNLDDVERANRITREWFGYGTTSDSREVLELETETTVTDKPEQKSTGSSVISAMRGSTAGEEATAPTRQFTTDKLVGRRTESKYPIFIREDRLPTQIRRAIPPNISGYTFSESLGEGKGAGTTAVNNAKKAAINIK